MFEFSLALEKFIPIPSMLFEIYNLEILSWDFNLPLGVEGWPL